MSKKMVALTAVLVFLLAGASVFGFLMWRHKGELVASPVSFVVDAEGWSLETSSPIPLHVAGQTVSEEEVDVKYFVGRSEGDLLLKPGTYEVEVYASPVNGDGGMYRVSDPVELVVPENTDKTQTQPVPSVEASGSVESSPSESASSESVVPESVVSVEISLSPVPANEVTDEEIEAAQAAMKEAGLSEAETNTFVEATRNARQAELDRIKAQEEEERKAKEQVELMQKTFGAFAGEYWFEPAYTACGMPKKFTLDSTGKAHGGFDHGHMGVATRNEFSITFSNPVPRADGFEANYQITYAHTPGSLDSRDDYICDSPEYCTFGELYSPSSGKAIFYNSAAQSDVDVERLWFECHISDSTSSYSFSSETKPDSSTVHVIKLEENSGEYGDIFFSK
ncbi:MAG: hypothetical protein IKS49_01605 [Actinomycetaceae bacterium]|nr:hypothetical protein [Actinomycetaceae bacterium]